MKNKKIMALTSGLSAAAMLTTGIGVACAAPVHTQLKTTSSVHQPLKDSTLTSDSTSSTAAPIIDMNSVGSANILRVVDANQSVTTTPLDSPYPSTVDAPNLNVAPWASIYVQFSIKPNTKLTAGEQIRIPFNQLPSQYAQGYVSQFKNGSILHLDGVDAFKLSLQGTQKNANGESTAGYFVLTVLPAIANLQYTDIHGAFSFIEIFDRVNLSLTPDQSNLTFGTDVNGDQWKVNVAYKTLVANETTKMQNLLVCSPDSATDFNGIDWTALQNAYSTNKNLSTFLENGQNANTSFYGYEEVTVPSDAKTEMSFAAGLNYVTTSDGMNVISNTNAVSLMHFGSGHEITIPSSDWNGEDPGINALNDMYLDAQPGDYAIRKVNSTTYGVLYDLGSLADKQNIINIGSNYFNNDNNGASTLNAIMKSANLQAGVTMTDESQEMGGITVDFPGSATVQTATVKRSIYYGNLIAGEWVPYTFSSTTIQNCPINIVSNVSGTKSTQTSNNSGTPTTNTPTNTPTSSNTVSHSTKDASTPTSDTEQPSQSDTTKPAATTGDAKTNSTQQPQQSTPAKTSSTSKDLTHMSSTAQTATAQDKETTTKNPTYKNNMNTPAATTGDAKTNSTQQPQQSTPAKTSSTSKDLTHMSSTAQTATAQDKETTTKNPTYKNNMNTPAATQQKTLAETGVSIISILAAMCAFFGAGLFIKKRHHTKIDTNSNEQ